MTVGDLRMLIANFDATKKVYFEPYDDGDSDYDYDAAEEITHVVRYENNDTVYLRPRNPREYAKKNREET